MRMNSSAPPKTEGPRPGRSFGLLFIFGIAAAALLGQGTGPRAPRVLVPDIPDEEIVRAYERAAVQNVLAAVNPKVFFGYWSVCADGQGFGFGYTYPSLDGHQMSDALLRLGQVDVVKANWDYVRSFQHPDGSLPIAVLPDLAGKMAGEADHLVRVEDNGGLYRHWVPGNPLAALAAPTYIQNADVIFRHTLDAAWLKSQIGSVDLAADALSALTDAHGQVKGAGYYIERPARIDADGVTQCHAIDAFRRAAALNRAAGDAAKARRYEELAERIRSRFLSRFWVGDHFAEYDHPERGLIDNHGLTDVNWAALALDVATPEQRDILWPKLKDEKAFYYGGMPTGIATRPEAYEDWEFTHPDRHDLAAMGRVWYLEAQARARMGDAEGLVRGIRKVADVGRAGGYFWRERYQPSPGGVLPNGPNTYCEYPANLIRIVQRFLLGVEEEIDGSLTIAPVAPGEFWRRGFGQTLEWRGRTLRYRLGADGIAGTYAGPSQQRLGVRLPPGADSSKARLILDGRPASCLESEGLIFVTLPPAPAERPSQFEIIRKAERTSQAANAARRP